MLPFQKTRPTQGRMKDSGVGDESIQKSDNGDVVMESPQQSSHCEAVSDGSETPALSTAFPRQVHFDSTTQ